MTKNNAEGSYCIVRRMPIRDACENKDPHVSEAAADYLKTIMIGMVSKTPYACFVCEEPWSHHCAPHQFLLIETMDNPVSMASGICGACCSKPEIILAALDNQFDTNFMIVHEPGHA